MRKPSALVWVICMAMLVTMLVGPRSSDAAEPGTPLQLGMFDPSSGMWHFQTDEDETVSFPFGAPGDIPLLGDIPGLGYLFKSKTRRKIRRNLFIFVTPHILRQRGTTFDELHKQSWIAKMKADELIEAIEIHNSNFRDDPRFKSPNEADVASIDISSLVDAGRFQSVPAERALLELEELRRRAK